jgi:hypothetical protein
VSVVLAGVAGGVAGLVAGGLVALRGVPRLLAGMSFEQLDRLFGKVETLRDGGRS